MNTLIIDTGSSSMRGYLLNIKSNVMFSYQINYKMHEEENGTCVMDPFIFKNALIKICKEVYKFVSNDSIKLDSIALTSQRSSILPIDKNGTPLHQIITWHDTRSYSICKEINEKYGNEIYSICGTRFTPVMSAPKMLWLKNNLPVIYEEAYKIIGIHDYLLYLLTDNFITDSTLASRTCLLDIKEKKWSSKIVKLLELDLDKLCDLVEPGSIVGYTTQNFNQLTGIDCQVPVISAGGDQQCSVLGQGIVNGGEIGITVGTGAYVAQLCNEPVIDTKRQLNLNVSAIKNCWILEASTLSSGIVYQWFKEKFYDDSGHVYSYEELNKEAASINPDLKNLIFLPYLSGKGCPDWDNNATGLFYNFDLSTTKAEFLRAVIEGIASEIAECYKALYSVSKIKKEVILCGGMSQSILFAKIISSMINQDIYISSSAETTVLGGWIQAMVTMKIYNSHKEALKVVSNSQKKIMPDNVMVQKYKEINLKRSAIYREISKLDNTY